MYLNETIIFIFFILVFFKKNEYCLLFLFLLNHIYMCVCVCVCMCVCMCIYNILFNIIIISIFSIIIDIHIIQYNCNVYILCITYCSIIIIKKYRFFFWFFGFFLVFFQFFQNVNEKKYVACFYKNCKKV